VAQLRDIVLDKRNAELRLPRTYVWARDFDRSSGSRISSSRSVWDEPFAAKFQKTQSLTKVSQSNFVPAIVIGSTALAASETGSSRAQAIHPGYQFQRHSAFQLANEIGDSVGGASFYS
jgi:hypothetical protein